MVDKQNVIIDKAAIDFFNLRVDELTDENNVEEMGAFINSFESITPVFNNSFHEAQFHYMFGNAYSVLFVPQHREWFDPNLNKAIIHYKKALKALDIRNVDDEFQRSLESQIATNLGNYLSQQGRLMCAKTRWKKAIELDDQPIAHTAIYQTEIYLSRYLIHDRPKAMYHNFLAYKSLCKRLELPNNPDYYTDSNLIFQDEETQRFKKSFEENCQLSDFDVFYARRDEKQSRKVVDYLKWCGENNLFINELNIDELTESIHPDSLSLPNIRDDINTTLAYHEELIYHSNFDEIKNDFCYARYLMFTALNIPNDTVHFFNDTFSKTDDLTHAIDNLKAQHLKSAFRIFYALFDKIAYFISHFFNLNDINHDRNISFERLFKKTGVKNEWKPNPKLENSKNIFLHALFYILKDLRDIGDKESVSDWLNPDIRKIYEIRNYIEHRSFKLIDECYEDLVFSSYYQSNEMKLLDEELRRLTKEVEGINFKLNSNKDADQFDTFHKEKKEIEVRIQYIKKQQLDKQKRVQHTLIMTDKDFCTQLFTLAELVRNSIVYLSFSIAFDNFNGQGDDDDDDDVVWQRVVPQI